MQRLGVITLMLTVLYMVNDAKAENKVTDWFQKEWNATVEFPKESWQDGKDQLQQNKLYIQDLFKKVKNYVAQD